MAKQLRPGDVLEISLPGGTGYLLYIGKHPEYGDAVSIHSVVRDKRPSISNALFDDSYVTFYPASAAVAKRLAAVIAFLPAPPMPTVLRRPGVRSGRSIKTWVIEDRSGETVKQVLTDEERRIPIATIWNHELLVQRILEGWRPETDG